MGTSNAESGEISEVGDHPHAYGDKKLFPKLVKKVLGSSPRVWGQEKAPPVDEGDMRIIPTRMGTSMLISGKASLTEDHPHAYGDKFSPNFHKTITQGSSPRVWGQVVAIRHSRESTGIIPTRMGTSYLLDRNTRRQRDHPHAYGDKTKEIKENSGFAKSTA